MTAIANLPDIRPSLLLDFANSGRVDPRIQCTRTSTATCLGPDGKLRTVAANVPRIDYDPVTGKCLGLLLEEARTNFILNSGNLSQSTWAKTRATAAAPDADGFCKVVEDGSNNSHYVSQTVALSASDRVARLLLKAGERTKAQIEFTGNTGNAGRRVVVDLVTGTVLSNSLIGSGGLTAFSVSARLLGAGVTELTIQLTPTATTGAVANLLIILHDGTGVSYQGDGVSGIYVKEVQIEAGTFPTSYIPTEASAVTRAADVLQIVGTSFSSWYRQDEGTVFGQAVSRDTRTASYARLLEFAGPTAAYRMTLVRNNTATRWNAEVIYDGVSSIFGSAGLGNFDGDLVGLAYKRDDFASASRGNPSVREAKSGEVPGITRLILGGSAQGPGLINGHISKIAYYPKRLTNAQLQRLTA